MRLWPRLSSARAASCRSPAASATACASTSVAVSPSRLSRALPMFTKDGVMPKNGPETVEKVLKAFNPAIQNADVDLDKTYTTEFVEKAAQNAG